jgi:hypothetical protein
MFYAASAERDAEAFIPVRRNGQPWKEDGPGLEACYEAIRAIKRLGRKADINRMTIIAAASSRPESTASSYSIPRRIPTIDRQTTELMVRAEVLDRSSQTGPRTNDLRRIYPDISARAGPNSRTQEDSFFQLRARRLRHPNIEVDTGGLQNFG